jgi:hypothetical protein
VDTIQNRFESVYPHHQLVTVESIVAVRVAVLINASVFSYCCSHAPHSKIPSTIALYVIVPFDSAGIFPEFKFHIILVFH